MLVMEMGYYEEVGDADDRDPRLLHLQYRLFPNAALVHDEPRRMHRSWREERTYGFPEWWP